MDGRGGEDGSCLGRVAIILALEKPEGLAMTSREVFLG